MIKNKTNIADFKTLCNHISLDNDNQFYFDQDLVDLNLVDIPTDLTIVEKVHTLCTMINLDKTVLEKDLETEIWSML